MKELYVKLKKKTFMKEKSWELVSLYIKQGASENIAMFFCVLPC